MSLESGHIALSRFGMGAAPGEARTLAGDPQGWLLDQLDRPAFPDGLAGRPDGAEMVRRLMEARRAKDKAALAELRGLWLAEAAARTRAGAASPTPLVERLVRFWSNHFTVSVARPPEFALAGAFEREAIRPHVTGRFLDLLRAVVRHPAMLLYLDNAQSIGPDSPAGLRRGRGLNENLARELMELHTLGVDGGYGQDDVEQLARVLTGWSLDPRDGSFRFAPRLHQPGPKTLLGAPIAEGGEDEGDEALRRLAAHPATARFVATKLARHFVADDPPAALVDALAGTFRDSDGDLGRLTRVLVGRSEPWREPLAKVRSPDDLVVAVLRGFDSNGSFLVPRADADDDVRDRRLVGSLRLMGQAPWSAPSPAGWPDRAAEWIGPEAMMRRLEWARAVAGRLGRDFSPELADGLVGAVAGPAVRQALQQADNGGEALFLLLASREFQRR
jgi:uncharacterized protein (DUF1800 family)